MKKNGQGVLKQNKLLRLFTCLLLSAVFCIHHNTYASTTSDKEQHSIKEDARNNVIKLVYSSNSMLQSHIAEIITTHLKHRDNSVRIIHTSPKKPNSVAHIKPEFVIAIGIDSIRYANINFTKTDTLLIASNPGEYKYSERPNNNNAVLFMSQSYCKQIHFINEINKQWNTIGYLNNKEKSVDSKAINRCARKYGMNTYMTDTAQGGNLSSDIKNTLINSDLILALPNKTIYNSKSVKNILLTSYRSRKPVIGFSSNFVNAGALASIHSNAEQIAHSANNIIDQYYKHGENFKQKINYPDFFDISVNRQVFRALSLPIPDLEKLKQTLSNTNQKNSGEL